MKSPHLAVAALLAFSCSALSQIATQAQSAPAGLQPGPVQVNRKPPSPAVAASYGNLPLSFEANQGQADPRARFLSHGNGYSLLLTDTAAVLELSKLDPASDRLSASKTAGVNREALAKTRRVAMKTDVVRMELTGARHNSRAVGDDPLPGKSNYFVGSDSTKWHTDIPTYAKVKYSDVYPGVDLVYYGNQRQLEYDFIVAPGGSAKAVKVHFAGASRLKLNADGDLAVVARDTEIAFHKPVLYQQKDGQRQPVEGKFTLLGENIVGFQIGDYDHSRELVIDPVLAYSTYTPASSTVAVDSYGDAYALMAGPLITGNPAAPTYGAYQKGLGIQVTKLNPAGTAAVYTAYFGFTGYTGGPFPLTALTVDGPGNAYITGETSSANFPVTSGAFQTKLKGSENAFVTKLNPSGSALVYSTFLGGSSSDYGQGIAVDSNGNAYVVGGASSTDFPVTPGAFQTVGTGGGFVTKLNSTGSALIYSTYLGGGGTEGIWVAIDAAGHAYVSGACYGCDFPVTPGAFDTDPNKYNFAGLGGFVAKLNPAGSALAYGTYFPPGPIAVDGEGNAYIGGDLTEDSTFTTTPGAFQETTQDNINVGFISKLNPSGTALVYSTYLGGSGSRSGDGSGVYSIALDATGDVFVTGLTADPDFPTTSNAFQQTNNGQIYGNAFVTELNPAGSALIYSTFLGGSGFGDTGYSLVLDGLGNVYVAGQANSSNFPVTPGAYSTVSSYRNGFVSKFVFNGATTTTVTSDSNPALVGSNVTFIAQVVSDQNSGTPGGLVEFHIDGTLATAASLDGSGQATYATTALQPGAHTIEALYRGGPSYSASSGFLTQTITGQVATPDIVPVGGTYRSGVPVAITDSTTNAVIHYTTDGSTPSASSPVYTAPITVMTATTIKAIAAATGDTSSAIVSASYTFSSSAKPVTVSFKPSPTSLTYGEPLTLTATVTTTDGTTATGTITFLHGSVPIGTATLSGGKATLTTSSLEPGEYSLTANYSGSATEWAKQSPAVVVQVNP
jgi:hypothetical protein